MQGWADWKSENLLRKVLFYFSLYFLYQIYWLFFQDIDY